jgi:hypothetical protein
MPRTGTHAVSTRQIADFERDGAVVVRQPLSPPEVGRRRVFSVRFLADDMPHAVRP